MVGFLLARAGVEVAVLEKHADFFRDFRGDTIHPSTLELMYELGLLDEFLEIPHQEFASSAASSMVTRADGGFLATCRHTANSSLSCHNGIFEFSPAEAKRFSYFRLHMQHEVVDLSLNNDRVTGVRVKMPDGERDFRADLVIGADGRQRDHAH